MRIEDSGPGSSRPDRVERPGREPAPAQPLAKTDGTPGLDPGLSVVREEMEEVRRNRDAELAAIDADAPISDEALADAILRTLHEEWRYEQGEGAGDEH